MQRRSREEWQALFTEQAASGLSAKQFCVQRDLCDKHFSLRKRQLLRPETSLVTPPAFVRVQKVKRMPVEVPTATETLLLRHGRCQLELRDVSPQWLATLLMALA